MSGKLRRLPILLVQAMALCAMMFAWAVARDALQTDRVVALAQRIERGKVIDPDYVFKTADSVLGFAGEGRCESRLLKAGLTTLLRRLDLLDPKVQASELALALGQTRAYIDHALACAPTDGNLWLRRAMISLAEGRRMDLVRADLARSQRFAPAEANVLAGRFAFMNRLPSADLAKSAPVLLADLETICAKPKFLVTLPKASDSLELVLWDQAKRAVQSSTAASGQKMRRIDRNGRTQGPGLWCEQLFPPS